MFVKNKVSVVTPVYNGENHLSLMLDSVLNQTYPNIEMILVDDGSKDQTVRLAESYREKFSDRGYEYRIVQAKHKCAAAAINQGLPYVTGEYLIWPDSDDILEPESVEKRVNFLEAHPEYQCVRTLSYYFSQKTGERTKADEKTGDLLKEDLFWDILESKTFVCCGCYMLRTEQFFEIYPNRHIPEYEHDVGQNFQMLLPFMHRHLCPTIQEHLYGVCVREGSHSRRKLTQAEEERKYREYEKLIDEIADICNIRDKASKKRMTYWKAKRAYGLAVRHGNKKQIVKALCRLYQCGEVNAGRVLKESLWIYFGNRRTERKHSAKLTFFRNMKKYQGYAVYVAKAQLKSEVASSYLNWIWWILEPFLTMIIYVIVFGYFFQASEPNYPVFLFIGILMWSFFSGVVKSSISVVKSNQAIISKVYVPKYILLLSMMYQYACKFGFGMIVEFAMMLIFHVKFNWHMLAAIPFLAGFFLFTFGCSSILIHFGVYVYDLTYAVGIILNFIMFLSGVFYSIEGRLPGAYGRIAGRANPVAFFIASIRNILIYEKSVSFLWLFLWCLISVVLSVIGVILVHKNENNYTKVI